jgi:hypothetical protein
MDWLLQNKEWFFSGVGVLVLGWIGKVMTAKRDAPASPQPSQSVVVNNQIGQPVLYR